VPQILYIFHAKLGTRREKSQTCKACHIQASNRANASAQAHQGTEKENCLEGQIVSLGLTNFGAKAYPNWHRIAIQKLKPALSH
jgi:hypothetical protein